jgi:predicted S18 family serine protease
MSQLKNLTDENEDMLSKLAQQEKIEGDYEELKQKLESVMEELESSQKACEYYQHDMIPDIKRNTEKMHLEMQEQIKRNQVLVAENQGLKGSMNDKLKHFEAENCSLKAELEIATDELEAAEKRVSEQKESISSISKSLNIKTQENMMKQEAIDDLQQKLSSLQE